MSNSFAGAENALDTVRRLGEMVYNGASFRELQASYDGLCAQQQAPGGLTAFGAMQSSLHLDAPEAMCVALWLYHDSAPVPPLTTLELLEQCRRIAGRSPDPVLSRLFAAQGERAVLHPIAANFLLERAPRLPEGMRLLAPESAETHIPALAEELLALLEQGEALFPLLIAIRGARGSGREMLIASLSAALNASLLSVELSAQIHIGDILLTSSLYGTLVCLRGQGNFEHIEALVREIGIAFLLCDEAQTLPNPQGYTLLVRRMPMLTAQMRADVFTRSFGAPLDPNLLSEPGFSRLSVAQTSALAQSFRVECVLTGAEPTAAMLAALLREHCAVPIEGAQRLETAVTLRDLAFPAELTRQLEEFCGFIRKRELIYERWGFGAKIPWGRGISALFYGSPGTGKTIAAAAVASEVGLPLVRVDLSQLISKYIGETQKNLAKIFDQAANRDDILFFDEADAVFARRSEAADAQDKYANAETAYLLQRMEQYDGVCILATNLLQNFDEAFRRRIGYMLHFPLPDAALRERIWCGIFPPEAPLGAIDPKLLAQHLELSGASIKNAAVHAAYLAAIQGSPIGMSQILAGAKNEYQKQGKTLPAQTIQLFSM